MPCLYRNFLRPALPSVISRLGPGISGSAVPGHIVNEALILGYIGLKFRHGASLIRLSACGTMRLFLTGDFFEPIFMLARCVGGSQKHREAQ